MKDGKIKMKKPDVTNTLKSFASQNKKPIEMKHKILKIMMQVEN